MVESARTISLLGCAWLCRVIRDERHQRNPRRDEGRTISPEIQQLALRQATQAREDAGRGLPEQAKAGRSKTLKSKTLKSETLKSETVRVHHHVECFRSKSFA